MLLPFPCYYDSGRKHYLVQDNLGMWMEISEASLKMRLSKAGLLSQKQAGQHINQVNEAILEIQNDHHVVYSGPLAGHKSGEYNQCGYNILVTNSPNIPEIYEGDGKWDTLRAVIENQLKHGDVDQTIYWHGWLKIAIEALRADMRRPGQALAIAGPAGCGKSLLQNLVTEALGGRAAKPYKYMMGQTPFNRDLFMAEHLMIEDDVASINHQVRRNFGAYIKGICVNEVQSCHGKHREALSLTPFWRLSITLNDEAENLMILPPLDKSIADKLIILKSVFKPMPMPTEKPEDRRHFRETLSRELPSYISWLLYEFQIPEELRSERYGITHFHHPELISAINKLAPETQLLTIIDQHYFRANSTLEYIIKSAEEIHRDLLEGPFQHETQKLINWVQACGNYLGKLADSHPDRILLRRSSSCNKWQIKAPTRILDDVPSYPLNGSTTPESELELDSALEAIRCVK